MAPHRLRRKPRNRKLRRLPRQREMIEGMMDLTTKYLGLNLKNPAVASASPLTKDLANFRRMEDAGMSAIVMHSLFEEQLDIESSELDRHLSASEHVSAESTGMFPESATYNMGPEEYLEAIV